MYHKFRFRLPPILHHRIVVHCLLMHPEKALNNPLYIGFLYIRHLCSHRIVLLPLLLLVGNHQHHWYRLHYKDQ